MMLLLSAVVEPVSAFVPNAPIVASLLPVVEGWCHRRRISPSKVLLPLSFATVLGGTLTLLGSSVNLLASEVSEKLGYVPTEVMSNAATVAMVIPIAGKLAIGLGIAPMALIFTVLFGASQSFLSPVGYQTNLMVFGPGRYRFLDVARYGFPLTVVMTLLVPLLICRQFGI